MNGQAAKIQKTVIPNGINIEYYQGDYGKPVTDTLIYSGALSYGANFDAMDYFLRQIWPLVLAKRPQAQLSITGKLDGVPLQDLPQASNVTFTGYLPDIRPAIAQSWINIVPLRIGGGTRLKILESLALKTPVVSTSKGAEGLELRAGQDLLIADEPNAFAAEIIRLLENPSLRRQLAEQGRQSVLRYDWDQIGCLLNDYIQKISAAKKSATP